MSALKYTVRIKFGMGENLRYLSHQETVTVFHRALVRSGVPLVYSEGFNPRPRLSLPLPRSVGIAVQDDLLVFAVKDDLKVGLVCSEMLTRLAAELPEGIELGEAEMIEGNATAQPVHAEYVFVLKDGVVDERIRRTAAAVNEQSECLVERRLPKKGTTRMVNVCDFVESVCIEGDSIIARCRITAAGAIRVDELMTLFGIEQPMLVGPIVRRNVRWQRSN